VNSILSNYARKDKPFQIKVGTLLTSGNITVPDNLINIFELLRNYSIDIWKIYEFVPEGRARYGRHFFGYPEEFFSLTVQSLYKKISVAPPFPIVISRRKERNRAYFVVQPDGSVMIPEDRGKYVEENYLGNILMDSANDIIRNWQDNVDLANYQRNIRFVTEDEGAIILDLLDRNILAEFSRNPTQTFKSIGRKLSVRPDIVDNRIKMLHERGILNSVIPIIDIDKLGFFVFNVFLSIERDDEETQRQILSYLLTHPFVPWIASCSGKWTFVIAVFARNIRHYHEIMMEIEKACENKLQKYESLPIYEKYIFGQRYLFYDDKTPHLEIDDTSQILLDGKSVANLTRKNYLTLARITGYKQPPIFDFSKQYGTQYKEISDDVKKLRKKGVLKKFIPTCDMSLLGYEWYMVLIKFRNLTSTKRNEFLNYVSSHAKVTHIVCCIGNWDVSFEMHARDNKEFREVYLQIKNKFTDIIDREDYVEILKQHKFNFLVDSIFEGKAEVEQ